MHPTQLDIPQGARPRLLDERRLVASHVRSERYRRRGAHGSLDLQGEGLSTQSLLVTLTSSPQIGFPVVSVEETAEGLKLRQNRFLSTGDPKVAPYIV